MLDDYGYPVSLTGYEGGSQREHKEIK